MSAALLAELERLDTEPAPPRATCGLCSEVLPEDAPLDAVGHADCDDVTIGWVDRAGAFLPPTVDPNSPRAVERRSELKATMDELFDEHEVHEIAFAIRVTAEDREVLDDLRAELAK